MIRWAKEHGACGVMIRAFEFELPLIDPYFFGVYEEAEKNDLPICIHAGVGSRALNDLYDDGGRGSLGARAFSGSRLTVVGEVLNLLLNQVPAKFPTLRWGVIEARSGWSPTSTATWPAE